MKNLFLVVNKEKIYAYVVSIMTIVVIFFMSNMMNSNFDGTKATSSNSVEDNSGIGEAVSTSTPNIVDNSEGENNTIENEGNILENN